MSMLRPAVLPLIALGLAAGGCSKAKQEAPAGQASMAAPARTVAAKTAVSTAPAGGARNVEQNNALIDFEYSYPAGAGAIGDLRAWLDADIDKQKAELTADAKEQQVEAKKGGYDYRALGRWIAWKVVTDLPGWLSLSQDISTYEGGAHPNHGFSSLVWDKQANQRRDTLDLFTSKAALSRAIRKDFCAALDRERAKKRSGEEGGSVIPEFEECIDPVESTIILGSSNRKAFDRVGVLIGPYAAGPYAEGDYEVTLPVNAAVLATVKPEYRAAFSTGR